MRDAARAPSPASSTAQATGLTGLGETKEGRFQLKEGGFFDKDVFQLDVGQKLKGTCKFYLSDFFGKKIIDANAELVNTADKPMYCQYYVAFFDKAGTLIGCAAQGTGDKGLAAGEKTHLGSCLVFLPAGCHEKVIQYKVAYYESDQEIGKGTASKNKKAKGNFVIHFGPGDENKEKAAEPKPMPPSHFDNPAAVAGKPSPPATARAVWYSAGPDWRELNEVVSAHGITLVSGNHEASLYRKWLADTRPGSVLVLLIALNKGDYDIPEQYRDLLPVPWDQIEASLQKGQNVVRLGKARNRTVFLFAAPTENVLKRLIHKNQLLLKLADK